jgi:hypothetical protein
MGHPTFARAHLKQKYLSAFSFKSPTNYSVVIYDLMKDMKSLPENVHTLDDVFYYFCNRLKSFLYDAPPCMTTLIVLVDREPPPVKRMVTHGKRYKNKDVFESSGAPYLPVKGTDLVPNPWIRFAGNFQLLQRELYPRLLNVFMSGNFLMPRPGQKIVFHGFPGYIEYVATYKQQAYALHSNDKNEVPQIHYWNPETELPITPEMEKRDPQLYNRIFYVENIPPCQEWPQGYVMRAEWTEASNAIREADGAMFFYDHFFQHQNIMFVCNDGDVFSYGLLYSYERVVANAFRNIHYVCLPYKKTTDNEFFPQGQIPKYEYVDFNLLYKQVLDDKAMQAAGVQNHVATLVFLLIMAETDFFKGYAKGVGVENVIWKTFYSCMDIFSHLVQLSCGVSPSTRTTRHIIIDEDAFRLLIHYSYVQKYGIPMEKKLKGKKLTYDMLKLRCSQDAKGNSKDDIDYHLPSRNTIRLWCRQVDWNIHYYKNAPFGAECEPDPYEKYDGLPLYPYDINPETGVPEMIDVVCARRKPVDEVYAQHMFKHKRPAPKNTLDEKERDSRKRRIIEKFDADE